MNTFSNNIPNRIKQPALCCIHCGKSYKKRVNMEKHSVICELLQLSRKKKSAAKDEDDEMDVSLQPPSQQKMFQMLIELGQKFNKLEEKVEEINKWVVKKKKKINVLDWLNSNIKPATCFDHILDKIIIDDEDIKFLFDNSFNDLLNELFTRTIYTNNQSEDSPMFAFVQKVNVFYIYDSDNIWIELPRERLIKFLNKVHMKIFTAFYEWKKTRTSQIRADPHLATKCDKTLIKLTSIEFKQEATLSKMKSLIYSKMKTDLKGLLEYDFEF
jgi:uncharacterized protein YeeX (DUF496 family)